MKRLYLAFIFLVLANNTFAQNFEVSKFCSVDNTSIEVSELKFSFDLKDVSKINILNGSSASSVVSFKDSWLPELHVITTSEDNVSGGINTSGGYEKLGVSDLTTLFNKIKSDKSKDEYFVKVKKAMGLTNPDSLMIIQSDKYNLYVMIDNMMGKDTIYILRHGDPRIMMLVADLTESNTYKLLEHTCI